MAFFVIFIDSLYLLESVVQRENFEKNFMTQKSSKTVEIFHLKFWIHPKILIPRFSILAIYVTNSSAYAS